MISSDAYPGDIYRDKQGNVWKVIGICHEPTVQMVQLVDSTDGYGTSKSYRKSGGISGLMWDGFQRIHEARNG
jgi:hypothetical protein